MISPVQFRDLVVIPAQEKLGFLSDDSTNLLMGTAYQESRLKYLKQLGTGPALGIFQMEPNTHLDIWQNFLKYQPDTRSVVMAHLGARHGIDCLKYDLQYMAMMARIHYRRVRHALPTDAGGYARYWKKYYNTPLGAGTEDEFRDNYTRLLREMT